MALVTTTDADAYFASRLDVAAWNEATSTQKAEALETASQEIGNMRFQGVAVSDDQMYAFPRVGYYFDPMLGRNISLDSPAANRRVLRGVCELAYHLLNNDGLLDSTGGFTDLKVEGIEISGLRNPSVSSSSATNHLKPLLQQGGSNLVWRAN